MHFFQKKPKNSHFINHRAAVCSSRKISFSFTNKLSNCFTVIRLITPLFRANSICLLSSSYLKKSIQLLCLQLLCVREPMQLSYSSPKKLAEFLCNCAAHFPKSSKKKFCRGPDSINSRIKKLFLPSFPQKIISGIEIIPADFNSFNHLPQLQPYLEKEKRY